MRRGARFKKLRSQTLLNNGGFLRKEEPEGGKITKRLLSLRFKPGKGQ
jgi:hypothetical protein